jgi:hypothetical protein
MDGVEKVILKFIIRQTIMAILLIITLIIITYIQYDIIVIITLFMVYKSYIYINKKLKL